MLSFAEEGKLNATIVEGLMSSRYLWIALWVTVVATSAGCETIKNYPVDRAKDFVDMVGFNLYWGQGFIAQGRMTKIAQMGVGSFDGEIVKYQRRALGVVEELRSEAGVPLFYFTAYDRCIPPGRFATETFRKQHQQMTGLGAVHYNLRDPNDRGFYEVGADVAVFLGLGVNVDVYQVMDFVIGWFGIDIGKDDARHRHRKPVANPRYQGVEKTPLSGEEV